MYQRIVSEILWHVLEGNYRDKTEHSDLNIVENMIFQMKTPGPKMLFWGRTAHPMFS